jgi:subtilisin family serine protease
MFLDMFGGMLLNQYIKFSVLLAGLTLFFCQGIVLNPFRCTAEEQISFLNDRARDIAGATAVNTPGFLVPGGLSGEGQIVAIADSGLDKGSLEDIHPDLKSIPGKMPKVVMLKSWAGRDVPDDPIGHGTHMAATLAGTGAASGGKFRGIAPGASLYFQAILNKYGESQPPENLADLFRPAYQAGARIHVDGWGGGSDVYRESSSQVDDFVRSHPDFLVIFGAGNSGPSDRTITAEANSKNALAIGASVLPRPALVPGAGDTSSQAVFSSRGPTGDGRIKPELLAPGSAVISARSSLVEGNLTGFPEYTSMQGTSMASAVAGGSAALLREYMRKYLIIPDPSAALLKAILINGARTAEGGPSKEGFGVLDLSASTIALKDGAFQFTDEIAGVAQEEEKTYTFHVADPSAPVKVTLDWTDPPDTAGSGSTLVNDLDLIVKTPDGKVFYGNHFLGANTPDRLNNVEQVFLPSPEPGEYTVHVVGAAVLKNTGYNSSKPAQDYALVYGQAPVEGVLQKTAGKPVIKKDGKTLSMPQKPLINLIDDGIIAADDAHLFTGAEVLMTEKQVYLVSRVWRANAVKVLNTAEGTVFSEINPDNRLGGFYLAPDGADLLLNDSPSSPDKFPTGVEINAVVNPLDQKIRWARAANSERKGVILEVQDENGLKKISLAGDKTSYQVMPGAVYSYEDDYGKSELADMPFGTGALDELEDVLPGMPVTFRLAPSTRQVQYLAVQRQVILGTVRGITAAGEIKMENGSLLRLFPGAPVNKDKESSDVRSLKQGDHISAVILPDTGEAIGLVAYSKVFYGKVIDCSKKSGKLYLQDDSGSYLSFDLSPQSIIYRWGVRGSAESIDVGLRIRITVDPLQNEVWRLDIADTAFEQGTLAGYNKTDNIITMKESGKYLISDSTRFSKNGYQVTPNDLLTGEKIELEYAAVPQLGNVLLSVSAQNKVPAPLLTTAGLFADNKLKLSGKTDPDTKLYIRNKDGLIRTPVVDDSGRFTFSMPIREKEDQTINLVVLNEKTGGINGSHLTLANLNNNPINAMSWATTEKKTTLMSGTLFDWPLTRSEAAVAMSQVFNWSDISSRRLSFSDINHLPLPYRTAIAEASARGIFKGYADGSFHPDGILNRAEAAVILAALIKDLNIKSQPASAGVYSDIGEIPHWSASAVDLTTASGIFHGHADGSFAPDETVTARKFETLLERVIELYIK